MQGTLGTWNNHKIKMNIKTKHDGKTEIIVNINNTNNNERK